MQSLFEIEAGITTWQYVCERLIGIFREHLRRHRVGKQSIFLLLTDVCEVELGPLVIVDFSLLSSWDDFTV